MNAPVTEIKRGRKFDQVVEGAREIFLQDGFEGASVDLIAKAAGVSKATLYSYFPDKKLLFMEIATQECRMQADTALHEIDFSKPAKEVLTEAATRILDFSLSPFGRGVFRICVAEADRFPDLGREFHRCGPEKVRESLVSYFEGAIARKELEIADLTLAADQFTELCKADLFSRLIMGVDQSFTKTEADRIITGAVEMFMARYGARA
ncbi:TetR/AcrR family transcriptional regulator [Alphaproteobacteria bacterium KMM 3653]|uniref:TetR/AcrR family transcriptional regulator n=1 Tax=Harenicola maris TaxID=2841044 RepID=A0AAP2G7Z9_9RHOB|nr:TetR/AcrR family transcriptional regulator [Harenicola maris]